MLWSMNDYIEFNSNTPNFSLVYKLSTNAALLFFGQKSVKIMLSMPFKKQRTDVFATSPRICRKLLAPK